MYGGQLSLRLNFLIQEDRDSNAIDTGFLLGTKLFLCAKSQTIIRITRETGRQE